MKAIQCVCFTPPWIDVPAYLHTNVGDTFRMIVDDLFNPFTDTTFSSALINKEHTV